VHALESLHASMRPNGLLLDVRPAPEHPVVEIVRRSNAVSRDRLGHLDDSYRIGTLTTADAALHTLIDAGQFVWERIEAFTFIYYFDSEEAWLAYMAEHWATAHVSADLVARAEEAHSAEAGELRILRPIQAARLRRRLAVADGSLENVH
jgi:hypothetical protein